MGISVVIPRTSNYVMRRQIRCMDLIETQYYNFVTGKQKKDALHQQILSTSCVMMVMI